MKQKGTPAKTKDKLRQLVQVDDKIIRESCITYYKYMKMKYRLEITFKNAKKYKEMASNEEIDEKEKEKYME